MLEKTFIFRDPEGMEIFTYRWEPDNKTGIRGVVQIAHGMAETAGRYIRFAEFLTSKGYMVYANDHRGHGKTAKTVENTGYCGEDGFNWMVKDLKQLNEIIHKENPNMPIFLFGHSMGSMLAQQYISIYGYSINGVILSGTSGKQGPILDLGIVLAKREVKKNGARVPSYTLNRMTFKNYNKEFKPARTDFDWLSRDNDEVDNYINDPFCGGVFSAGFFYDFLRSLKEMHKKENMAKIPKDLPIYIFSGDKDPVGKNTKTLVKLIKEYKRHGIKDVAYKFYKDGRHVMLDEINRNEVMEDVLNWLNCH